MKRYIIGLISGLILGASGIAYAASVNPQEVDVSVPCQKANQLNCSWYGESLSIDSSENTPPNSQTYWINTAKPDGVTFCQVRIVPYRTQVCATHWPLTAADYGAKVSTQRRLKPLLDCRHSTTPLLVQTRHLKVPSLLWSKWKTRGEIDMASNPLYPCK